MKKIFYNGTILTMTKNNKFPDALLIDENIIMVGSVDEVYPYKDNDTIMVNLNGKTIMPGFIDSHSHITAFAKTLDLIDLGDVKTKDEVIAKMKESLNESGDWVIGFGFDENEFTSNEKITKNDLDLVSTRGPVLITHKSGHFGIVNSCGLAKLSIDETSKNPSGGAIERFENSLVPNGRLMENAFFENNQKIKISEKNNLKNLKKAYEIYASYGITTLQDGITKKEDWKLLKELSMKEELLVDTICYLDLRDSANILKIDKEYQSYLNNLKIGGYKILLDGSPQAKTAWLKSPYLGMGNYTGTPIYQDEEVIDFFQKAKNDQQQILVHANGDKACLQFVKALKEVPMKSLRPVCIHAQLIDRDELSQMKDLGAVVSFFTGHIYYYGDIHLKNIGERALRISPVNSAIKEGLIYTFHTDTPVILPNLLEAVWCAVARKTKSGKEIAKDEKVSVWDALKAITINAAYQYHEENLKGTIETGKIADLVILNKNPLKAELAELKNIEILEVIKKGKTIYQK